jgi:cytochrome c553
MEYGSMLKATFITAIVFSAALVAVAAHASERSAGKQKYESTCSVCHGRQGISVAPIYPNLAGQKQEYLISQLKAFRDGSRKNAIMGPLAKPLSDTDIKDIAAYLSKLKP